MTMNMRMCCGALHTYHRDVKDRERFACSSYHYLCGKRDMDRLQHDYLDTTPACAVLFSPPADARLTVEAVVGLAKSERAWLA